MMKKNFRNRLLAVTAAAASSFLLLSGFDSALTVQDVNDHMREALSSMGGFSADMNATADILLDVAMGEQSQSIPITGSMDMSVQLVEEPFALAVSGNAAGDASAMGVAGSIDLDMYLLTQEDGSGVAYVRFPQGGDEAWHAAALSAEDMEKYTGAIKAALSGNASEAFSSQLGTQVDVTNELMEMATENMILAPEAVSVNGVDCYEMTQSIDGNTLFEIISKVVEAVPTSGLDASSLSAFQMFFDGIRVDTVTDVAVDTFQPVYAGIDLSGSDFSALGQLLGSMMFSSQDASSAAPQIGVTVNALNCSINYSEAPAEIIVPEEALAAEIETTLALSDVAAAAATTVG
ncbi:MAG TPA: hypothetical protein DHV42_04560 [Lachnospiraceae bacterium]|nr:hypothetical protein [Lachnospiraceae bacterium]